MKPHHHIYDLPKAPRSYWELIHWSFNEPTQLSVYGATLSKAQTVGVLLQVYWRFTVGYVIPAYLLLVLLVVLFDVPTWTILPHPTSFLEEWHALSPFWEQFAFLIRTSFPKLAEGLAIGGLAGLVGALTAGLAAGLVGSLTIGLAAGLTEGLAGGLTVGVAGGLAVGCAVGMAGGLAVGLAGGWAIGLAAGLGGGWAIGGTGGWAFTPTFYLFYFRMPHYLLRVANHLWFPAQFHQNSYLKSAINWLPIRNLERQLLQQAQIAPQAALPFVAFLLKHRPLQQGFAMQLQHTALAAQWRNSPVDLAAFDAAVVFKVPLFVKNPSKYHPSSAWQMAAAQCHESLLAAQEATHALDQLEAYQLFVNQLDHFHQIHLAEAPSWTHYYKGIFDHWQQKAQEELQRLQDLMEI